MPTIRPAAGLSDNYNDISELCSLLDDGLNEVEKGKIKPMKESIKEKPQSNQPGKKTFTAMKIHTRGFKFNREDANER
jgi:hypothetical protein